MRRADLLQVIQVVVGPVGEHLRDREGAVLRVSPVLRLLRRAQPADVGEVRAAERREGRERLALRGTPEAALFPPPILVPPSQTLPRPHRELSTEGLQ